MKKIIKIAGSGLLSLIVAFLGFSYFGNYQPSEVEEMDIVCDAKSPSLTPGATVKVLSWNVQYMAGKNYVFFYDKLDGSGKDSRPSRQDIDLTFDEVAGVIKEENPDIILIQEVDENSKRTDYENQVEILKNKISTEYGCYTSAFYHKSAFVPHPMIMGSVGLKMATYSKYKMTKSIRHQLEKIPANILMKQYNLKRAVLETWISIEGSDKPLALFNTHLDAFAQGYDTMEKQVKETKELLDSKTKGDIPWLIGGDFNLLPPGESYARLADDEKAYYQKETELQKIFQNYSGIPALKDVNSKEFPKWFTHIPNGRSSVPDRTIDFIFYSPNLKIGKYYVRHQDTQKISDHMPLVAYFTLPGKAEKKQ